MEKLYSAKEFTDIVGLSKLTLYRLAKEGKIKSYRIGSSIRFNLEDFVVENDKENIDE